MANPKILYTDLSTYTFSSSAGTNSSYPLSNLNNYIPNSYWSGSSTASNQRLVFDLGASKAVTDCIVDGHNFNSFWSGGGTIAFQYADNAAFTSNVVTVANFPTSWDDIPVALSFNSVNKRYFALLFTAISLDTPPRVGNLFIGTPLTFTTPYSYGYKTENTEYVTSEFITLAGTTRTSQQYKGRIVYELNYTMQNAQFKTDFQLFQRTVRGKMFPFYFIDTDGTTIRYMNMLNDYQPVTTTNYGLNSVESLVMKSNQAIF